jgi:glycosyltransferase involved in cell wall biosynthesis
MRLSVIIPAYKVEGYIEKCVRSLEDQDIPKSDYEIIVTNDGSPDRCKEVIENLQKEFSNLILINQENQGVSMARNNAIAIAKGKYILPIDPDDYVLPNTFSRILDLAETKDLDVLYLGFEIFDAYGTSEWHTDFSKLEGTVYDGLDGFFVARGLDIRDPDRSWAMLYKKAMLNKYQIDYPKGVPFLEDGLFLAKVFAVAEKVGYENDKFYQRTTRLGSATNSKLFLKEESYLGFLMGARDVRNFKNKYELKGKSTYLYNHIVAKYILTSFLSAFSSKKISTIYKVSKLLKNSEFKTLEREGVRGTYLRYSFYYNKSITRLLLHLIYRRIIKQK